MTADTIDAVSLGILWDRLVSITNEIELALVRTSFSTIVRESWDLASILFDAKGRTLASGVYSMPTFTGTAPQTMAHMLERFPPETLEEGDVIFTNNSWLGTGHSFDVNVMRPAFRNGRIIGYTFSITHLPDIGGRGFSSLNTTMYEEGLQIPICKIVRKGQVDQGLLDLIRMNVRVPEQVLGDITANITACETGCRKLVEFLDEYELADLDALADAIIGQTESAMRRRIAAMPDGTYAGSVTLEGNETPITLRSLTTIKGDRLHIDFEGSDPQMAASFNVPVCYTRAFSAYAFKVLLLPNIPNNQGCVTPIEVSAPVGSILNAQPPVATAARHMVGHHIPPMIYRSMAVAMADEVCADTAFTNILNLGGRNRKGREFATLFFTAGGLGAMNGLDGRSTTPAPSNMRVLSTEVLEELTGLTIDYRKLRMDSGGAGQFQGGAGQIYRLRNTTPEPLNVIGFGRRNEYPALGLNGGQPGALREYRIAGKTVHPRSRYVLQPGESIEVLDAGGGGYGDPKQRDAAAIEADISAGRVSPEGAKAAYGYDAR